MGILLSSFIVSFLGSIPPGAISLSILQKGKTEGLKKALQWSVFAGLSEGLHLYVAWTFNDFLNRNPIFGHYALLISGIILGFAGLVLILKKNNQEPKAIMTNLQFFLFNLFYFIAIPFWLAVIQLLQPSENEGFLFGIGSVLGGIVCLSLYAWLGARIQNAAMLPVFLINRSIAVVLIGLSIYQSIQFFINF
jgi:hypothetical protein